MSENGYEIYAELHDRIAVLEAELAAAKSQSRANAGAHARAELDLLAARRALVLFDDAVTSYQFGHVDEDAFFHKELAKARAAQGEE